MKRMKQQDYKSKATRDGIVVERERNEAENTNPLVVSMASYSVVADRTGSNDVMAVITTVPTVLVVDDRTRGDDGMGELVPVANMFLQNENVAVMA